MIIKLIYNSNETNKDPLKNAYNYKYMFEVLRPHQFYITVTCQNDQLHWILVSTKFMHV